jgi:hypothetical protein
MALIVRTVEPQPGPWRTCTGCPDTDERRYTAMVCDVPTVQPWEPISDDV